MNDTYALKFNNGICVGRGRQKQLYLAYFDEMRGRISAIISADQLFEFVLIIFLYIKSCYNAFESVLSIDIISCVTCTIIIKIKTNDDVAASYYCQT